MSKQKRGDVLMAAETGSGKTGAFCLPVLQIVHETNTLIAHSKAATAGAASSSSSSASQVTMSLSDRDATFAIAEDGLLCQSRSADWAGARATQGIAKGKYYYEATVTDEGLCRLGWSTITASRNLGTDKQGFGFGGTGKKAFGGQFENYGLAFGVNDTIGCFIDMDAHQIFFSKNGSRFDKAFDIPTQLHRMPFYPAAVVKNAEMRFNFGAQPFKHPCPGFEAVARCPRDQAGQSAAGSANQKKSPSALILEPSRELATQIYDQLMLFKKYLESDIRIGLFVGGVAAKDQMAELRRGVDIAVGTPGRVDDLVTSGSLDLSRVRFLILDEADGLLAQGHRQLIQKIFNGVPKDLDNGRRLQMIVCSATLHSNDVKALATDLMHFPTWIDLKGKDAVPDTVHQVCVKVNPAQDLASAAKTAGCPERVAMQTDGVHVRDAPNIRTHPESPEALSEKVKKLKPFYLLRVIEALKMDQAIIFCRTKLDCDHVRDFLLAAGGSNALVNAYSCVCLHSDVRDRDGAVKQFKNGEVRFLLCTDVAARGIDVTGLPFVVNYTLPDTPEVYIHRIGRVGRAERMGLAVSLISDVPEKVWYHTCANRDRGCTNSDLTEKGGCTIWYDEPALLRGVQAHVGENVAELTGDFALSTQTLADGKIVYGEKRAAAGVDEYQAHTAQLAPSVVELAQLEVDAQYSFWSLKSRQW
ncbi:DEAD box polypeptide 1 [Capsaspora owczarzaki ATCC 30864]|uniref:ATP-dependent RNA helicase n=2 Tax=Capsaspora owczarzaki (strain ATCC 30864) TaxID=595528 RepID=A0A0D2U6K3_CAPO3|nr:DEAD box polypeptide 1 [Capsaspora owczarzaki ATCC 30864]KJE90786.1 DEAD box polypeptide 1, variant 1 [Capsaspora owczarzaki ATCC 30864]|eukprot:XP_004348788.2 DEAD box polypeptide 1 [Capsaspora owczarzaki ATCC 30864]